MSPSILSLYPTRLEPFNERARLTNCKKSWEKVVPDKETRRPIDHTVDRVGDEAKQLATERKKLEKEVLAALKRHDTPAEQFPACL